VGAVKDQARAVPRKLGAPNRVAAAVIAWPGCRSARETPRRGPDAVRLGGGFLVRATLPDGPATEAA
jgi:hypothetical protein